jgi:hypothetical protein
MKSIALSVFSLLALCASLSAGGDIKPAEIKEMVVIGTGPSISSSMKSCYDRMYDSCKRIESVSNRDSQWTGAGWITTFQVKYKVVH